MGTKAYITFENEEQYIYRFCDGFPNGIIPVIEPLIKEYSNENKKETLLQFISKKLDLNIKDEDYKNGFMLYNLKDDKDPWCSFSYHIYNNGVILVRNIFTEEEYKV